MRDDNRLHSPLPEKEMCPQKLSRGERKTPSIWNKPFSSCWHLRETRDAPAGEVSPWTAAGRLKQCAGHATPDCPDHRQHNTSNRFNNCVTAIQRRVQASEWGMRQGVWEMESPPPTNWRISSNINVKIQYHTNAILMVAMTWLQWD